MSDEYERIWLAPRCCADPDTGRHWAQDPSPWPCPDCTYNGHGVEYVRADLVAALRARAERAEACVRTARAEALRDGFDAGFAASGEGWNGDFPEAAQDAYYRERREELLSALVKKEKPDGA